MAFQEGSLEVCEILRQYTNVGGVDDSEAFVNQAIYRGSGLNSNDTLRSQGFNFKDVLVHIDLKGSPPIFDFLMRYLEFVLSSFEFLVTGFVFEFEDMFPFQGHLSSVASPKAYSREQI